MENINTKSNLQKYFCVCDNNQKEELRNSLNVCFGAWCFRKDFLALEPLDVQIKALEDMSLNINSFCFFSAEAQEYIINNCEKYKNVLG